MTGQGQHVTHDRCGYANTGLDVHHHSTRRPDGPGGDLVGAKLAADFPLDLHGDVADLFDIGELRQGQDIGLGIEVEHGPAFATRRELLVQQLTGFNRARDIGGKKRRRGGTDTTVDTGIFGIARGVHPIGKGPDRLRAIRLQSRRPAAKPEAGISPTGEGGPLILGFGVHVGRAPDNLPIFDCVKDDAFAIADSNHSFKMVGSSKLMDLVSFSMNC